MVLFDYKMWQFVLVVLVTAWCADAKEIPPSCSRPVYCNSTLLHHVQLARLFNDSKTFVDLEMNYDENKTLTDFDKLLNDSGQNPSREQLQKFVDEYFSNVGELEAWVPTDFSNNPEFVQKIQDVQLRKFGQDINDIWPIISRKVKDIVFEQPERFSLVPLRHGFMIPGGRFKEIYYWDTYWIIKGLLISGMKETAKGVIENLIDLLHIFGHIPNGSRWYYQERSQPPLLSAMMAVYYKYTKDLKFIEDNIDALEKEVDYWLDTQMVLVKKGRRTHKLLRYNAVSSGPRPESYREDYENAQKLNENERTDFYINIKSAAESGWDFSSRWFINEDGTNNGTLLNIETSNIAPVDLNSIFAGMLQNIANFHKSLKNIRRSIRYSVMAQDWRNAIEAVLWNEEAGIWYDYDIKNEIHREYFYPSNLAPLWQNAVDKGFVILNGHKVINYLQESGALDYAGGIPTSLTKSGEQWDLPNVWPPLVSIVVNALDNINKKESSKLAVQIAQDYVRACRSGFTKYGQMFEKYDANRPGEFGDGGEYTVQIGFGWSNGVVLEFLTKYASELTSNDS